MPNIFIIHGTGGSPNDNWFPWLKKELEKLGCKVFVPQFPTPENQTLENWLKVFKDYEQHTGEDCIIVGHSLGVPFILNLFEKYKAKAAFLVAGYIGLLGSEFDEINHTITDRSFDWKKIKSNCKEFFVYCSDDDWAVPLEKAKQVSDKLGVKPKILHNAGHINQGSGFYEFEQLLEDIKHYLDLSP